MNNIFLIMFVCEGLLLVGLSIPLIRGQIPPNSWYGFRVPRTINDPDVWYPSNTYAAWRLLWVGVMTVVAAIAAYFIPNMRLEWYASIVGTVAVAGLVIAVVQSFLFLNKLPNKKSEAL